MQKRAAPVRSQPRLDGVFRARLPWALSV